jgi:hypothetical protein
VCRDHRDMLQVPGATRAEGAPPPKRSRTMALDRPALVKALWQPGRELTW